MIAFFQTGGVGDAILGISVAKKLHEMYGEVSVLYSDHLVPQVYQGAEFIHRMHRVNMGEIRSYESFRSAMSEYEFVVFNKFRRGPNGRLNFFLPVDMASSGICNNHMDRYTAALSRDMGRSISDISDVSQFELVSFFNSESDYFSDWRRFGVESGYDGVSIDIFPYTVERNAGARWPEKFIIVHDSRLPSRGVSQYPMKSWDGQKWAALCSRIRDMTGLPIVQILSRNQDRFVDFVTPHSELIGQDAMFQDYLYMLSRAVAYIGTDSWPAHAAIFVRKPAYLLLKGAVSRRWDHGGRYSRIIRTGACQACEGLGSSASRCLWNVDSQCMKLITPEMVFEELEKMLCERR